MYGKTVMAIFLSSSLILCQSAQARIGAKICKEARYYCHKVKSGQSWESLFPNKQDRLIAKKVNRMNVQIRPGMTIAIPHNLSSTDIFDVAPFSYKISPKGNKYIEVSLGKLAWGAYNEQGHLVNWGPVSGGKDYCPDVGRACLTDKGHFTILTKMGSGHKSSKYPRPHGGAPMPYAMHFNGGIAFHAAKIVPGYNASHGCVRMFYQDAKWLNRQFATIGTKVFVGQ